MSTALRLPECTTDMLNDRFGDRPDPTLTEPKVLNAGFRIQDGEIAWVDFDALMAKVASRARVTTGTSAPPRDIIVDRIVPPDGLIGRNSSAPHVQLDTAIGMQAELHRLRRIHAAKVAQAGGNGTAPEGGSKDK